MISFENLILVFYISILNATIKVVVGGKINTLLLLLGVTKSNYDFKMPKHFLSPLYYACTPLDQIGSCHVFREYFQITNIADPELRCKNYKMSK